MKKKKKNGAVVEQVMKEPVSEISALETEGRSREEVTVRIEHRVSELVAEEHPTARPSLQTIAEEYQITSPPLITSDDRRSQRCEETRGAEGSILDSSGASG